MATMKQTRFSHEIDRVERRSQAATSKRSPVTRQQRTRARISLLKSDKHQQREPQDSQDDRSGPAADRQRPMRAPQMASKRAQLSGTFPLSIRPGQKPIRRDLAAIMPLIALLLVISTQAISSEPPQQASRDKASPLNRRSLFDDEDAGASGNINGVYDSAAPLALSEQLALSSSAGLGGEKPRLIPLVAADSGYSENSSVNILCTVSQGHHESLQFDWFKDGQLLAATAAQTKTQAAYGASNHDQSDNELFQDTFGTVQPAANPVKVPQFAAPQIEKSADHSLLRISRVQSHHSGRYTCAAKNKFGQDSSSVNLIVNVKLQWIKEPPKEIVVSLSQELKVDCLAGGEPKPSMRWEKLDSFQAQASSMTQTATALATGTGVIQQQQQKPSSGNKQRQQGGASGGGSMLMHHQHGGNGNGGHLASASAGSEYIDSLTTSPGASLALSSSNGARNQLASKSSTGSSNGASDTLLVSSSRYLTIQRVRESDSGIYECIASNSHGNDLRKLVNVQVRGPPKILPIATADSYPEGSSINLICTVSGGQRRGLTLSWTLNGEDISDANRHSELFNNVAINTDDADISILKIKNATLKNSGQYTCTAKNPLGQDSTSVKIVINVDMKWSKVPKDKLEVGIGKEVVLECNAIGSPQPTIEWIKHSSEPLGQSNATQILSKGGVLKIARAQHRDSGLYECLARNGVNDNLRKFVELKVRGKYTMRARFARPQWFTSLGASGKSAIFSQYHSSLSLNDMPQQ